MKAFLGNFYRHLAIFSVHTGFNRQQLEEVMKGLEPQIQTIGRNDRSTNHAAAPVRRPDQRILTHSGPIL